MAVPIWKDFTFTIAKTSAEFRLKLNNASGAVIYTGRAVARPNESSIGVKVNDICADYIRQSLPVWGQEFSPEDFSRTFYMEYYDTTSETWKSAGSVEFLYDWSYDPHYLASRDGFSFPIRGLAEGRQYLLYTTDGSETHITANLTFKDGSTSSKVITIRTTGDFNDDYNSDFAVFDMAATSGTAVLDLSDYPNVVSVEIEGNVFRVDQSLCHNYALYYVNAYGGWDALMLSGRVQEQDNYTRHNQGLEYDNTDVQGRGTRNYVNEITKTFTLQTGWLDDLGASRMHHLLGSTMVVLHDLSSGDLLPVVLTNADCPYKTYGGEGNALINYTIEATIAQERMRK